MNKLSQLSRSIKDKVVLITGAASGMGRATAYLFSDEGARVVISDINEPALAEVEAVLRASNRQVISIPCDCSDRTEVERLVQSAATQSRGLDFLVNNAGIGLTEPIDGEAFDSIWHKSLDVMLNSQQWAVRAALPWLREAEHARVINISSTYGLGAAAGGSAYIVAKHGVIGLTRALACELGPDGITVNAVCPGPINTGLTESMSDEDKEKFSRRRTALLRFGRPEEVAHMILNLALPASDFVTGATITVDAGLSIRFG